MTTINCTYWAGHCVKCLHVASHFSLRTKSLQLCPTLCSSSPLGSSVHGIFQARILEWVAMPSFRGSSQPRDWTCILCLLHWQVGSLSLASPGKPLHLSFSSVHFSHSVVSNFLRPHVLPHARPPCPSPTPGVYPNSCPLSQWCHPTISSSVVPFPPASIFPSIRAFSSESGLRMRWPKYWSFSFNISPSNEHSGLISFRIDWLDLLAVQGTLKSLLQHHSSA